MCKDYKPSSCLRILGAELSLKLENTTGGRAEQNILCHWEFQNSPTEGKPYCPSSNFNGEFPTPEKQKPRMSQRIGQLYPTLKLTYFLCRHNALTHKTNRPQLCNLLGHRKNKTNNYGIFNQGIGVGKYLFIRPIYISVHLTSISRHFLANS